MMAIVLYTTEVHMKVSFQKRTQNLNLTLSRYAILFSRHL